MRRLWLIGSWAVVLLIAAAVIARADIIGEGGASGLVESGGSFAGGPVTGDIDMTGNAIDNASYVATDSTPAATTGWARMAGGDGLCWRNAADTNTYCLTHGATGDFEAQDALRVYRSETAGATEYGAIYHDGNNTFIDSGIGGVTFPDWITMAPTATTASAGAIRMTNNNQICWYQSAGVDACLGRISSGGFINSTAGFGMPSTAHFSLATDVTATATAAIGYSPSQTVDSAFISPPTVSNVFLLAQRQTTLTDYVSAAETNPTFRIQSGDTNSITGPSKFVSLAYDQNYGVLDTGDRGLIESGIYIKDHLKIGTTGTHATTGQIRLANNDKICWESNGGGIDRCLTVDSTPKLNSNYEFNLSDNAPISIGTGRDLQIIQRTSATPDTAFIGLGSESLAVHFMETADIASTLDTIPLQTNPTVYVHAANFGTNQNTWVSLTHDQNNAVIDSGSGGVSVPDYVEIGGGDVADSGSIRMAQAQSICWEYAGGDTCILGGAGVVQPNTNFGLLTNYGMRFGTSANSVITFNSSATPDSLLWSLDSASRAVHLYASDANLTVGQLDRPQQQDATIFLHANGGDQNTWFGLSRDQNVSILDSGKGSVSIRPNRITVTKGGSVDITMAESILTCDGGGSATLTATSLVPAYSTLLFVTSRIGTALTGSTGYTLGDGLDADLFGTAGAATQGTTTANPTAQWTNPQLSAVSPVVTFSGGSCTAGSVTVQAAYIAYQPAWTN